MRTPKLTLFFWILTLSVLIAQDLFFHTGSKIIELIQDIAFISLGSVGGFFFFSAPEGKNKPSLLDPHKIAKEVNDDEKKQLQAQVQTLKAALEKLT